MTRRDVAGRFKGSFVGLAWLVLLPLLLLAVYTFVFSSVFRSRWSEGDGGSAQFALILFCGMIALTIFTDVLVRAPGLIVAHSNYVKRVVFPLETLPAIVLGTALFHAAISLGVLLLAIAIIQRGLFLTVVLAPLVLAPLCMFALGAGWFLAAFGVFVRDLGPLMSLATTMLTFLSPVFYPISAIPESLRPLFMLNPLTFVIEQLREVLIWGRMPNWGGLALYSVGAYLGAWAGYAWFQRTRKGFSDVL